MTSYIFLAHTPFQGHYRVGSHHLAVHLAERGHFVLHHPPAKFRFRSRAFIGSPRSQDRSLSLRALELTQVLSLVPPELLSLTTDHGLADRVISAAVRRKLIEYVEQLPRPRFIVVDKPQYCGLASTLGGDLLVYRPTDWLGLGTNSKLWRKEHHLVTRADLVVSTSEEILRHYRERGAHASRYEVIRNGVELARFIPTGNVIRRPNVVVYVGAMDDRFDHVSLASAAVAMPDVQFELYGPVPTWELRLPANVRLCGPLAYEAVPATLASASVGVLPLVRSQRNEARSPMKFYEYLAAGLKVVALSTPELRARNDAGTYLYNRPEELRSALDEALRDGTSRQSLSDPSLDWSEIAARFDMAAMGAYRSCNR